MDALNTRGGTSSAIFINLFDIKQALNMYTKQETNDYEEGQDILEDDIMVMLENKYKYLVRVGE